MTTPLLAVYHLTPIDCAPRYLRGSPPFPCFPRLSLTLPLRRTCHLPAGIVLPRLASLTYAASRLRLPLAPAMSMALDTGENIPLDLEPVRSLYFIKCSLLGYVVA